MKVLGINGSPRIGGNTDILLDKALLGAKEEGATPKKIILADLTFSPCLECENPKSDGSCLIEDDMQLIYEKIKEADALILASPIFFGSLSAQMKMMIDRFQCVWRAKHILKKDLFSKERVGAFISVGAMDRRDFFENSKGIVKNLFATINTRYKEELFSSSISEKKDILKDTNSLKKAYDIGRKIAKKEE